MARKPSIDPSVRARARQLRKGGKSREAVRKALAAEGHDVSTGWLSSVFAEPEEVAVTWSDVAAAAPVADPPAPPAEAVEALLADLEDPGTTMDRVRLGVGLFVKLMNDLLDQNQAAPACDHCQRASSSVDVDVALKIGRGLVAAAAATKKIEPDIPPDPNEAPDVRAARDEAADLLFTAVDRAIKRRVA
jgi:hypothetical protein